MNALFDQNAIAAHDRAFASAHPDWDEVHRSRRLVDPVVCLARRESPEDGAPACGAWLSEHCPDCGCCPGVHADDCDCPERTEVAASIETDAPPGIARYGIPARIGGRIVFDGRPGVITGYHRENAHILVLLDGDTESVPVHPTWRMTYLPASASTPKG